jgi:hypothetical protein
MEIYSRLSSSRLLRLCAPHSLGKLIEWKFEELHGGYAVYVPSHSLGKLIEWKLLGVNNNCVINNSSPLVGETN